MVEPEGRGEEGGEGAERGGEEVGGNDDDDDDADDDEKEEGEGERVGTGLLLSKIPNRL